MKLTAALSALTLVPFLVNAMPGGSPAKTTTITVTSKASTPTTASQCSTGPVQCCNSVQSSNSASASTLLGLLGIVLQGAAVPVGINCTPINVLGIGGNSCSAQAVCCENNQFNGLINIGCTPINL